MRALLRSRNYPSRVLLFLRADLGHDIVHGRMLSSWDRNSGAIQVQEDARSRKCVIGQAGMKEDEEGKSETLFFFTASFVTKDAQILAR